MKLYIALLFLLFTSTFAISQKHDQIWLLGYANQLEDTTFGGTIIDFSVEPPILSYQFREMNFGACVASICDKAGNLLFYTNDTWIANADHIEMMNGDSLGLDAYHHTWQDDGLPFSQTALILPYPNTDHLFILIHEELTLGGFDGNIGKIPNCYYSVIDMNGDNGLGEVILKNQVIVNDTLDFGKITATKHANGRDWWILVPQFSNNKYHTLLFTPDGISLEFEQEIGDTSFSGVGQAVFSPDGKKYVRFNAWSFAIPGTVDIFDFDRCTGLLSNPQRVLEPSINGQIDGWGGVAISSNSKFLYFVNYSKIIQYDLDAVDITGIGDTVAIYDGFVNPPPVPTSTRFRLAHLAPNGKIYINTPANTRSLHVIHNPNEKGIACNIEQRGLDLPTYNNRTIPNFPNFRLYAEDGSTCDTIRPIAQFDYDPNALTVTFLDESLRTPTEWLWTFGDGESSMEQNPLHVYSNSGMYEVCLIASNEAGSDTTCQMIDIILDGIEIFEFSKFIKISPNPTGGNVLLEMPFGRNEDWDIKVYDAFGRVLLENELPKIYRSVNIMLGSLPVGVYFYKITNGVQIVKAGKIVRE